MNYVGSFGKYMSATLEETKKSNTRIDHPLKIASDIQPTFFYIQKDLSPSRSSMLHQNSYSRKVTPQKVNQFSALSCTARPNRGMKSLTQKKAKIVWV